MLDHEGREPDLDRVFQALSDPGRRAMLERLCERPATVSELARPMSMTLAAVVQHVQVLEACGLVRSQKRGRQRICTLDAAAFRSAERWLSQRRRDWELRLDQLGAYLLATEGAPPAAAGEGQPAHTRRAPSSRARRKESDV
jgi:DNA-binding transcriptional ArsR family regulator